MQIKTVKLNKTESKQVASKTEAQSIWEEIENLTIQMFGLPGQTVAHHCTVVPIEPTHLYVTIRSSAVLPALEVSLKEHADKVAAIMRRSGGVNNSVFIVEQADKYIIISRAKPSLFPTK
jgi:hypothetical protein